jgi:hypothetical protein
VFDVVLIMVRLRSFGVGKVVIAAVLAFFGTQSILKAQGVVLSLGNASAIAGARVSIPIVLTSDGSVRITGLQWIFSYTSDITSVAVFAGPSTTDAQKSISCSGNRCLVSGFNDNTLADGTIAVAIFQIATRPSATAISIALNNAVSSTVTGAAVPASGGSGAISLFAPVLSNAAPAPVTGGRIDCAEFQVGLDGRCLIQNLIPWVTFGGVWESRLKMGNLSSGSNSGPIQVSFTLRSPIPLTGGVQNHLLAVFSDNRSHPAGELQIGESATYSLLVGESVDVHFLYAPAGCDTHGENCGNTADPSTPSYGSLLVQYSATDPAYLRGLARAQLTFLAQKIGTLYGWQAAVKEAPPARMWKAPVEVNYDKNANSLTSQEAAAAIANPGAQAATIKATLYDQYGKTVTSKNFELAPLGVIGFTFSSQEGFGQAMFPQQADFSGWVTVELTSPTGGTITVLVLQYIGDSMSSVDVQSFP